MRTLRQQLDFERYEENRAWIERAVREWRRDLVHRMDAQAKELYDLVFNRR